MLTGTTPTLELVCDMPLGELDEFSVSITARIRNSVSRAIVTETVTVTENSDNYDIIDNTLLIWLDDTALTQLMSVDPQAEYVMLYIQLRGRAGLQQIASREFVRRLSRTEPGGENNDRIVQMAIMESGGVIRQHGTLLGRDSPDAHPMSAISGLDAALESLSRTSGIPIASVESPGVVQIGDNISVTPNGQISIHAPDESLSNLEIENIINNFV